ncbi:uncharacterized protein [Trachinotus anak]|uniref:uncharacterized protein n=1 Tax=Trachinotus anak TaxID=443729 RepID=UPI0039F20415
MFVLIWATLFFFMRHSDADTGASVGGRETCSYGFCITLPEGEITAEAGLCVVIPCSFTTVYGFTPQNLVWYKCEPAKQRCSDSDMIFHTNKNDTEVHSEFRGRVSLLEPDVSQNNCSIIITDLTGSDSGFYQLRVDGDLYRRQTGFTYPLRATVSIKGDFVQRHGPSTVLPWAIAGASLSVNVFCIICILFLWNARKKVKPNQEDGTYMSLQKKEQAPEYDVIAQPLK